MKTLPIIAILPIAIFSLSSCDVKKTQEGEMPEVEVTEGQLPKYDVDAGDIDVGTETKTVEVEVPTIDVDTPAEDEAEDGTE